MHERQDAKESDQEFKTILEWLPGVDYGPKQSQLSRERHEGTGEWFLQSAKYQHWVEVQNQTLFCPGIPGAGKSIMTSIIVDDLFSQYQSDPNVGIAYVYCSNGQRTEQTAESLLASIVKQLVRNSAVPEGLKKLYQYRSSLGVSPTIEELSEALCSLSQSFSRVYIVVDALDECQGSSNGRAKFLSELFRTRDRARANILATSRPIPEIKHEFGNCDVLEIRASPEDIQVYLQGNMYRLQSCVRASAELQKDIREAISKMADGMYVYHVATCVASYSAMLIVS